MKRYARIGMACCLALAACSNLEEANYTASTSLNNFKNDTGSAWKDLFTYNSKPRTPQPSSTRYCYQFASDIVCYDNPQPDITSRLVGVQGGEGARMIVYQPAAATGYTQAPSAAMFPEPARPLNTGEPFAPASAPAGGVVNGKTIQAKELPAPTAPAAAPAKP